MAIDAAAVEEAQEERYQEILKDPLNPKHWNRGGRQDVLRAYAALHRRKIFGHWLWAAVERIGNGEHEEDVMRDYGYKFDPEPLKRLGKDGLRAQMTASEIGMRAAKANLNLPRAGCFGPHDRD